MAAGPDTGVNHGHVYGMIRKEPVAVPQNERPLQDVLRAYTVSKVHHHGSGIDIEDDPFHHADSGAIGAEISGQNYQGWRHGRGHHQPNGTN